MSSKNNTLVWVLAGTAVVSIGFAAWMYQSKRKHENDWLNCKTNSLQTPEDRFLDAITKKKDVSKIPLTAATFMAQVEPAPLSAPYGCNAFMQSCVPGDVGGCSSMRQSCTSADNSVRLTMARPGECDQFRRQCEMGDYGSCDMYNRGCLHESF